MDQVSIAMCTYQGERYLAEQLASLASQICLPSELVVSDDCSTDGTLDILHKFKEHAPFEVRILRNECNIGVVKNFEKAMASCRNDIVMICDQDDYWHQNKIKKYLEMINIHGANTTVIGNAYLVDQERMSLDQTIFEVHRVGNRIGQKSDEENYFSLMMKTNFSHGCTMAFPRSLLSTILPIPESVSYYDLWTTWILSYISNIYLCDEPLMDYRQHESQFCGGMRETLFQQMIHGMSHEPEPYRKMLTLAEAVKDRLSIIHDPSGHQTVLLEEKIQHLRNRLSILEQWPHIRFINIVKEYCSGRYHRCSLGMKSALRDLI